MAAIRRRNGGPDAAANQGKGKGKKKQAGNPRGYFEYWVSHLDGGSWSKAFALPHAKGRSSTRMNAAISKDGGVWVTWPTDNRSEGMYPAAAAGRVRGHAAARRLGGACVERSCHGADRSEAWACR